MVANVSIEEAIKATGTAGRTKAPTIRKALKTLGIKTGYIKVKYEDEPLPDYCICNINFITNGKRKRLKEWSGSKPSRKRNGHFIIVWGGVIYDPLPEGYRWPASANIVSYFEIIDIN
jgi:hypothetical protein